MKDYSEMTDFEISHAVARAIGFKLPNSQSLLYNKTGKWELFDPCNNPSDAWPIIIENKIAIIPDAAAGEWVAFNEFTLHEGDWMFASDPDIHANSPNPLRAAMIVYLMKKDEE